MQRATGTMKTILFRLFVASLIVHDTYVCAFLWIEPQCSGRVSALSVALGSANRIVSPSSLLLSIHDAPSTNTATSTAETHASILQTIESIKDEANEYAESFGLGPSEAAFYGLFLSIRRLRIPLGLHGHPFLLRHTEIETALHQPSRWPGFFTLGDLEKALSDDFLDAARGSTDNRKGWQVGFVYYAYNNNGVVVGMHCVCTSQR